MFFVVSGCCWVGRRRERELRGFVIFVDCFFLLFILFFCRSFCFFCSHTIWAFKVGKIFCLIFLFFRSVFVGKGELRNKIRKKKS